MTATTQAPLSTTEPARHWIGGQWTESGVVGESIDPSTGEVIGTFYDGGAAEAAAGIAAARRVFDSAPWSHDVNVRARALYELADGVEANVGDIAAMLSRENGKLLWETGWEVATAAQWLRYSAASCLTAADVGRAAETAPGVYFHSHREPLGVAGIITPWNSPVILAARSLGPALAAGCTAVVKLPAQTALTAALVARVVAECKTLPDEAVNIFVESGNEGAPLLVESPDVDIISYTGSTVVGRQIAEVGGRLLKRLNLELGGKTPLVIFDDADVDNAVSTAVRALTMMNGQFCVTGSRLLVQRGVADDVRERLVEALAAVQPGPPSDPSSQLGPLIDRASAQRVDRLVEDALAYATPLVRGGRVTDGPLAGGAFYRPTLLEVDRLDVPLIQDEIFGPVQTFEVFDDEADAVRRANATAYGLGAAVFTASPGRARAVGRLLRSAAVWINTWGLLSEHFEQGGFKASSHGGSLCGPTAIERFQELKVYTELAPAPAPIT